MEKRKILIQLDSDPQPSVFDRVVAIDAGADEVFAYGGVKQEQVQNLVHGAIFTRGPKDLKNTAIFIGGSDVAAGEKLLQEARKHMIPQFGLTVSILLDANGANTTAAAVLGGTGPVGQRVARLLGRAGAEVMLGSRQEARAAAVCSEIKTMIPDARLVPVATGSTAQTTKAMAGRIMVIAAGAAGAVLLPLAVRQASTTLKVAIDLNAVPPMGIEGIEATDKGVERGGVICYGALGVGGTKMKIHKAAIARLFESNQNVLDAEEIFAIALALE
jgi:hypothetical protein